MTRDRSKTNPSLRLQDVQRLTGAAQGKRLQPMHRRVDTMHEELQQIPLAGDVQQRGDVHITAANDPGATR